MMRLIPFAACALLFLGAPSMAFESLTCVATGTGSNVRYMIDGKHIHIREKGKHEKHPLSNHRRVANQDLWDSMLDGVQPGTLTVANRRLMSWNPAGRTKVYGVCRDARPRDASTFG